MIRRNEGGRASGRWFPVRKCEANRTWAGRVPELARVQARPDVGGPASFVSPNIYYIRRNEDM